MICKFFAVEGFMFRLASLFRQSGISTNSGTALIPYIHLQKYFQLFVDGIFTVNGSPKMDDLSIKVPGQILQFYQCPEAADFFSEDTSFTTTATFDNNNGGHIYHGEYITHGKNGGALECLYIVIASSKLTDNEKQRKFVPHFVFLGGCMAGETHGEVYSLFMLSQSGYDGQRAISNPVDQSSAKDVLSALSYADIPFRKILSGEIVNPDEIAADFCATPEHAHQKKVALLATHRTPDFLKHEINSAFAEPRA